LLNPNPYKFTVIRLKDYNYQNFILVFLWLSPIVKFLVGTYILDINWTGLAMVFAVIDIFFIGFTHKVTFSKKSLELIFIILLIYGFLVFSLIYAQSSISYKYTKVINFTPSLIFFFYPLFMKRINLSLIIKIYIIFLIPSSAIFIYLRSILWVFDNPLVEAFMEIRRQYLTIGFHLGVLFLLLYYYKSFGLIHFLVLALLFGSSARGAFLFTFIIIFLILATNKIHIINDYFKLNKKRLFRIFLFLLFFIMILFIFKDKILEIFQTAITRFSKLTSGDDVSSQSRIEKMLFALNQPFESIMTFLFGYGIGSFGILFGNSDVKMYPHNLFLEAFFELGIIGVMLFFILNIIVFKNLSFKTNIFSFLFLFAFLNAMKSNSLIDLWMFFSFAGCLTLKKEKIFNAFIKAK